VKITLALYNSGSISDRCPGVSRQFAFAQFSGIPEARQFLESYYPTISLYGAYDPTQSASTQPAKVRIAFSRDDRDKSGKGEDDWKCEVVCLVPGSYYLSDISSAMFRISLQEHFAIGAMLQELVGYCSR
jgi:hypothetical protein